MAGSCASQVLALRKEEDFPSKQRDRRRDHPHHLLHEGAHPFHRLEMPWDPPGRWWPEGSFLPSTCKALEDPMGW